MRGVMRTTPGGGAMCRAQPCRAQRAERDGVHARAPAQGPNTAVVLWSVPARLRPFAMSLQVIVIHVLGDVPSPVALGALQERLHNWRCAPALAAPIPLPSSAWTPVPSLAACW